MRSKAPAGRASLSARCPHAAWPREAWLCPVMPHAPDGKNAKVAPFHSLSYSPLVHHEPTPSRGTPAPAALSQIDAGMQWRGKKPLSTKNNHAVQENRPFSCKMCHFAVTFPDDRHETSRAIQSSRRPRISFRTMSIWYLTSGSTAMSRHASSVGWKGRSSGPISRPLTGQRVAF